MLPRPTATEKPRRFRDAPWTADDPHRVALEQDLSPDDLEEARTIERLVATLDLQPLWDSYAGTGSPAYSPALLLTLVLYETRRGRHRPTEWFDDSRRDVVVRWLLRGLRPSRAVLYRCRDHIAGCLDAWNQQVLRGARRAGVRTDGPAAIDGTFVAACASRHRRLNGKALERQEQRAQTATERIENHRARAILTQRIAHHQATQTRRAKDERRTADRVVISPSEPEAVFGKDKAKTVRPLYDIQVVVAVDTSLVLAADAFATTSDVGLIGTMLDQAEWFTGQRPAVVVADTSYSTVADLVTCDQRGVQLYAPLRGEPVAPAKAKASSPDRGPSRWEFVWDPVAQTYRCPAGQAMQRVGSYTEARSGGQEVRLCRYRCPAATCDPCPLAAWCGAKPGRGRSIKRSEHEPLVAALRVRMSAPEGRSTYGKRKRVERVFGDWKENRGWVRLRRRGLSGARSEARLMMLVHNGVIVAQAQAARASPPVVPEEAGSSGEEVTQAA